MTVTLNPIGHQPLTGRSWIGVTLGTIGLNLAKLGTRRTYSHVNPVIRYLAKSQLRLCHT